MMGQRLLFGLPLTIGVVYLFVWWADTAARLDPPAHVTGMVAIVTLLAVTGPWWDRS